MSKIKNRFRNDPRQKSNKKDGAFNNLDLEYLFECYEENEFKEREKLSLKAEKFEHIHHQKQ